MRAIVNGTFYAMIPVNVALIAWVWFGRMLFGSGGWFLLILAFSVVPGLLLALAATTVLAFTQRRPAAVGRLTGQQAFAQVVVWVGLLGLGFFLVDFGDAPDSDSSAFTEVFGRGYLDVSMPLAFVGGGIAAAAWVWLLVVLIMGNVQAAAQRRESAAAAMAAYQAGYAAPVALPPVPAGPGPGGAADVPPHPAAPGADAPTAPPGTPP